MIFTVDKSLRRRMEHARNNYYMTKPKRKTSKLEKKFILFKTFTFENKDICKIDKYVKIKNMSKHMYIRKYVLNIKYNYNFMSNYNYKETKNMALKLSEEEYFNLKKEADILKMPSVRDYVMYKINEYPGTQEVKCSI